jgi:hypothetical protein
MRKRKRDWPLAVYRYWAKPVDLPASVWTIAEAMRTLWNRLVTLNDDALWIEETLLA